PVDRRGRVQERVIAARVDVDLARVEAERGALSEIPAGQPLPAAGAGRSIDAAAVGLVAARGDRQPALAVAEGDRVADRGDGGALSLAAVVEIAEARLPADRQIEDELVIVVVPGVDRLDDALGEIGLVAVVTTG